MVPDAPGPVHAYMHAAPGCWALYCGLEDWKASLTAGHDAPTLIQHLVDSYAVQHAANPDRRNRQSSLPRHSCPTSVAHTRRPRTSL